MMRLLLRALVPLLAPFVLYLAYRLAAHSRRPAHDGLPWFSLTVTGLLLACLSLGFLAMVPGTWSLRSYVAARIEHGLPRPADPEAPGP